MDKYMKNTVGVFSVHNLQLNYPSINSANRNQMRRFPGSRLTTGKPAIISLC